MNAASCISTAVTYILMWDDLLVLDLRNMGHRLLEYDTEIFISGFLIQCFPAGTFHHFCRIAFSETHDAYADSIHTAFKHTDEFPCVGVDLLNP